MRGKTETEIEEILTLFIKLFAYLYSRDAFLKIYAKLLAKRLINNSSFSFDHEKEMVKKLGVFYLNLINSFRVNVVKLQ